MFIYLRSNISVKFGNGVHQGLRPTNMKHWSGASFLPLTNPIVELQKIGEALGFLQNSVGFKARALNLHYIGNMLVGYFQKLLINLLVVPRVVVSESCRFWAAECESFGGAAGLQSDHIAGIRPALKSLLEFLVSEIVAALIGVGVNMLVVVESTGCLDGLFKQSTARDGWSLRGNFFQIPQVAWKQHRVKSREMVQ